MTFPIKQNELNPRAVTGTPKLHILLILTVTLWATLTLFPQSVSAAPSFSTLYGMSASKTNYLNWTNPDTQTGAVTFTLKQGTTTIYTGNELTYTHTGLTNGQSYTYTVTSTDSTIGTSPVSNTVKLTPAPDADFAILDSPYGDTHLRDKGWCWNQHPNQNLPTFDGRGEKSWAYALKNCDTGGGVIPHFDADTTSYLVLKNLPTHRSNPDFTGTPTQDFDSAGRPRLLKTNAYTIWVAQDGKKLTLYKGNDQNGASNYWVTSTDNFWRGIISAEPNDEPEYKHNNKNPYHRGQYTTSAGNIQTVTNGYRGNSLGSEQYQAQVMAVNVIYASSWDAMQLHDKPIVGNDDGPAQCDTWDLPCQLGAVFNNLTDGFQNLVGSILRGIASLWTVDIDRVNLELQATKTQWSDKMGFLMFPFTFLNDIFNAFDTTNSWCSASNCQKSFGSFMGGDFKINFLAFKQIAPSLWDWILLFVRATTVLAVILMFKQKYMRVIQS